MRSPFSASKTPISPSKPKSVLLHTWWLIKVEEESRLGVGGYANREMPGRWILGSASSGNKSKLKTENQTVNRVFCSSAIGKRVDNNTLETVDGITITIIGCIHRSRTLSYGFSSEVCDHFHSGFPFNWEGYAGNFSQEKCERSLPLSFDDLPVTRVRDILMLTSRESETCAFTSIIIKDILKQCSPDTLDQSASYEMELDHKQDGNSLKIKEDSANSKETEAACVTSQAGTLPKSPVERLDSFSSLLHFKEKCDTTRVLGNKRMATRRDDGYPLRSKQMKKSKQTDLSNSSCTSVYAEEHDPISRFY